MLIVSFRAVGNQRPAGHWPKTRTMSGLISGRPDQGPNQKKRFLVERSIPLRRTTSVQPRLRLLNQEQPVQPFIGIAVPISRFVRGIP